MAAICGRGFGCNVVGRPTKWVVRPTALLLLAPRRGYGQDGRGGELLRVGERDLKLDAPGAGQCGGATVQSQLGRLAAAASDLDLPRRQPPAAKRLDGGLLGGEPSREVASGTVPRARVGQLAFGEQAPGEPRPPLQCPLEPPDVEQVNPDPWWMPGRGRPRGLRHAHFPTTAAAGETRLPGRPFTRPG